MGLFSAIVSVAVDVVTLPLSVAADVVTLGNVGSPEGSFTARKIEQIKEDAEKADE